MRLSAFLRQLNTMAALLATNDDPDERDPLVMRVNPHNDDFVAVTNVEPVQIGHVNPKPFIVVVIS